MKQITISNKKNGFNKFIVEFADNQCFCFVYEIGKGGGKCRDKVGGMMTWSHLMSGLQMMMY